MRKVLFGALLALVGYAFGILFLANAAANPWNYNGTEGLLGSLLGTGTLSWFIISTALLLAGLLIAGIAAFRWE